MAEYHRSLSLTEFYNIVTGLDSALGWYCNEFMVYKFTSTLETFWDCSFFNSPNQIKEQSQKVSKVEVNSYNKFKSCNLTDERQWEEYYEKSA